VRLIAFLCAAAAYAQAPSSKPPVTGLEPAWDIAVVLQEIGAHAGRLLPVLDRLDTAAWAAKGASETYIEQLESSKQQTRALADETAVLTRNPERLSGALQLFFRLESLGIMIASLEEGARRYQGAAMAQSLAALFGEGGANRERLRAYIVNLASEREHQFEVMDREAQRCRGTLVAPQTTKTGRKK
jgi:hypothetical protein